MCLLCMGWGTNEGSQFKAQISSLKARGGAGNVCWEGSACARPAAYKAAPPHAHATHPHTTPPLNPSPSPQDAIEKLLI